MDCILIAAYFTTYRVHGIDHLHPLLLLQVVVPMLPAGLGSSKSSSGKGSSDSTGSGGSGVSEEEHHVVLVGSVPALGCWDVGLGLRLARDDVGMWRGTVELPMGYPISAKVGRDCESWYMGIRYNAPTCDTAASLCAIVQ
jgi:hypothetical protein